MRWVRDQIKGHFKRLFELGQRVGVDVLPRHFYSSIPDFRQLRHDQRWRQPCDMIGVRGAELHGQIAFLRQIMTEPVRQRLSRGNVYASACLQNDETGYGQSDADVLFAFVAHVRPKKIVQVGCGVATAIMRAAAAHAGYAPELHCVEPYPTAMLERWARQNMIHLSPSKAQHLAAGELADLRSGDLLFVDSSHTTTPGSDVNHIVFNVLPRLTAGVYVHFHDIQFPYDFGPNIFSPNDLFFGAESLLVHAYLIQNEHCRIAVSLSMLHHARQAELQELLPNYVPAETERGLNAPRSYGLSPSAAYLLTE